MRELTEYEREVFHHMRCDNCGHFIMDHFDMDGHCQYDSHAKNTTCTCDNFVAKPGDVPFLKRVRWGE